MRFRMMTSITVTFKVVVRMMMILIRNVWLSLLRINVLRR